MSITPEEKEKLFEKRLAHVKRPWWGRGFDEEMEPTFREIERQKSEILDSISSGDPSWGECSERLLELLEARIAAGVERSVIPEIEKDNQLIFSIVQKLDRLTARVREPEMLSGLPREGEWVGADVFITSSAQEANAQENVGVVLTNMAGPLSWLLNELRDAAEGYLDFRNKFEFFEEIAEAAKEYIEQNGDTEEELSGLLECGVQRAKEVVAHAAERQQQWIGELAAECRLRQITARSGN
jgi:hypothetical protein